MSAILFEVLIMKYIIAIALIWLPIFCLAQKTKFNFDFALIFGSCFHNDSINIKINGVTIVSNTKLETNVVGSANFSISQDKQHLLIKSTGKIKKLKKVDLNQPLNIQISVNNQKSDYTFDIKKGRVLYAENCPVEGDLKRVNVLKVTQRDSPVYFF